MNAVEPGTSIAAAVDLDGKRPDLSQIKLCPYLLAGDGAWRSSTAAREHRCTGVSPAAPLAAEKQRRLCLTSDHQTCATYVAVGAARPTTPGRAEGLSRPLARTAPLVLDRRRIASGMPVFRENRLLSQGLLMGVMGVAFVAIVIARQSDSSGSLVDGSPMPVVNVRPLPSPTASPTLVSTVAPSATVLPSPSASLVLPAATPSAHTATYTVRQGDTLVAIAGRFGTTSKVLVQLNAIKDPALLRIGQVLVLP